jgi:hypothetical protein
MQAMDDKQEFPKALQLLDDPNIFRGDTEASVDMTPNKWCLTDSKPCYQHEPSCHMASNL